MPWTIPIDPTQTWAVWCSGRRICAWWVVDRGEMVLRRGCGGRHMIRRVGATHATWRGALGYPPPILVSPTEPINCPWGRK